MVSRNLLIALLSIFCFGGIIAWQLHYLREMKKLREEIFEQQAAAKLKEVAMKIRTSAKWSKAYKTRDAMPDSIRSCYIAEVDSLVQLYFQEEHQKLWWGLIAREKDSLMLSNAPAEKQEAVMHSSLTTCLSCLVLVSFPDNGAEMVVEHSIAQMRLLRGEIPGDEPQSLSYFSIYSETKPQLQWPEYLVFLFITGLSCLFGLSLYLNGRQKRLIEQKNEFINHLSHQFKTPLASIRLGTKMLLGANTEVKNREMLQLIDLEGKRLDKHIQTVLQWVRSDAQGMQLNKQPLDLAAVTRESIRQMEPVFVEGQTAVEVNFEENLPPVMADEYHLILVYFNLWENAIKHNPGPLKLCISILRQDKFIIVKHQDNGRGFSLHEKSQASPYTGLGLLYAERVMKEHGGAIEIISGEGTGATISLKFLIV